MSASDWLGLVGVCPLLLHMRCCPVDCVLLHIGSNGSLAIAQDVAVTYNGGMASRCAQCEMRSFISKRAVPFQLLFSCSRRFAEVYCREGSNGNVGRSVARTLQSATQPHLEFHDLQAGVSLGRHS